MIVEKDNPQRHKNRLFDIIAPIGPICKIKGHFSIQYGVVDFESGVHFNLADLLHGEKWLQSQLPFKKSGKRYFMQKLLIL